MHHMVRPGETIGSIAQHYGTTVVAVMRANRIQNPNLLYAGQMLRIPVPAWYQQPYSEVPQALATADGMPGSPYPPTAPPPGTPGPFVGGMGTHMEPQTGLGMGAHMPLPLSDAMGPHEHHPHQQRLNYHQQRLDALEARVAHLEARMKQLGREG